MRASLAALGSASASLRYCVTEEATGWWLFAAVALLVYAWRHRDD